MSTCTAAGLSATLCTVVGDTDAASCTCWLPTNGGLGPWSGAGELVGIAMIAPTATNDIRQSGTSELKRACFSVKERHR